MFVFEVEEGNFIENIEANNISVYPNPAENYITVKFEQGGINPVKYELFATSGELIDQGLIKNYDDKFQIDVSSFQRGLYFIKISNETVQCVFKISLK